MTISLALLAPISSRPQSMAGCSTEWALLGSPTCQWNGLGRTRCLVFPRADRFGPSPARIVAEFSGRQEVANRAAWKSQRASPYLNGLALAADNRLVGSSSPPSPTTQSRANRDFPVYYE
jgi:hypothetical protein